MVNHLRAVALVAAVAVALTTSLVAVANAAEIGRWAGTWPGLVFLAVFGAVVLIVAHRAERDL